MQLQLLRKIGAQHRSVGQRQLLGVQPNTLGTRRVPVGVDSAVSRVTYDGVPDRLKMSAKLVPPPRLRSRREQRKWPKPLQHPIARHRRQLPLSSSVEEGAAHDAFAMTATVNQRQVLLADLMIGEPLAKLRSQRRVGGAKYDARGAAVEAVNGLKFAVSALLEGQPVEDRQVISAVVAVHGPARRLGDRDDPGRKTLNNRWGTEVGAGDGFHI